MTGIGIKINELRKGAKLNQIQLTEKLNTTQDTILLWELEKSYPDCKSLIILAKLFDVTTDYLLGLED